MKFGKTFYRADLFPSEDGLDVIIENYHTIHETPCFHFVVSAYRTDFICEPLMKEGESVMQFCKRRNIKVRRIHKDGSRIAFETKEDAFKNLRYRKQKQIMHMERQIEFNKAFLEKCAILGDALKGTEQRQNTWYRVPDTRHLVNEHLVFD